MLPTDATTPPPNSTKSFPDVLVCEADFDVASEYQALCQSAPKSGAVVFFVGLVRELYDDVAKPQKIDYIELNHYAGMTEILCQQIIDQARERFKFDAARVVHRVGKLGPNEQIVMVAVASRHRDNAFSAAQFIMDYLKTRATLWKKEVGERGDSWVGMKQKDAAAAKRWD
jgi:molybdopterin synthase catalytic subunit